MRTSRFTEEQIIGVPGGGIAEVRGVWRRPGIAEWTFHCWRQPAWRASGGASAVSKRGR
jgi:hypothetical protein